MRDIGHYIIIYMDTNPGSIVENIFLTQYLKDSFDIFNCDKFLKKTKQKHDASLTFLSEPWSEVCASLSVAFCLHWTTAGLDEDLGT